MKLYISQTLINSLANLNACMNLCTNNVQELFTYKNKMYIILGTVSSGFKGVFSVTAYECILLENFNGKGVSYAQHGFDVMDGKRERGYENVTFKNKKIDWVITGEAVEFLPIIEDKQLELF
jgi:hypothetical protein